VCCGWLIIIIITIIINKNKNKKNKNTIIVSYDIIIRYGIAILLCSVSSVGRMIMRR